MNLIDKHAPGWIDALFADDGPLASGIEGFRYALIDCAFAPQCHQLLTSHLGSGSWRSLYENMPGASDEAIQHSPMLLNIDAVERPLLYRVLLLTNGLPMLSFIRSNEPLESLFERLSPWCIVNADGQYFVLRFPDTRRLPDVLAALSPLQQMAFCGPGATWNFRRRDASWSSFLAPEKMASTSLAPCAPVLDGDQCALLIAGSEADEVIANLLQLSPAYEAQHRPSVLHALAVCGLAAADAMQFDTVAQRMRLCEVFWQHPELSHGAGPDHEALRALMV
ncbi:DUF4123 domain-containing protein [Variovorax boronicumulans]|uniref:DUF4123 domain-containing protein n=1 Tax=Variovorax boronicumulans TaxID=436515 RepID=UPI0012E64B8B|nr:DUF4123 domain-containing protein [Variovorax boronicumulans]GER12813.1 DUF4123 domain-containing protein [Variovorax boronicumulans]